MFRLCSISRNKEKLGKSECEPIQGIQKEANTGGKEMLARTLGSMSTELVFEGIKNAWVLDFGTSGLRSRI